MQGLIQYWIISGAVSTLFMLVQFLQIDPNDWKWYSGLTMSKTYCLIIGFCMLFGGILLPVIIIDTIYKMITGKDLINF